MEDNKKREAVDVVCPNGFQIGHDYGKHMDCGSCGSELWHCAAYYKSCIKKADFGSEIIANMAARIKLPHDKYKMKSYRCDFCGGWHIGTSWE